MMKMSNTTEKENGLDWTGPRVAEGEKTWRRSLTPLIHEEGLGDVSQSLEVVDNRPPSHSPPSRSFHPFAIARVYWLVMLKKNGGGGRAVFAFRFVERGIK